MAVTALNLLQNGNAADQTSYATASVTPSAGKLLLLSVHNAVGAGTANVPTVTGCGVTWVQVATVTTSGLTQRITVYRALGVPTAGALTIDMAGQTQDRAMWILDEFDGVETGGANGADAVVQSNSGTWSSTNTGVSLSLSAFASGENATYGTIRKNQTTGITPGSGFNELADSTTLIASSEHQTQWKDTPDTSVDWSWASETNSGIYIALEIKSGRSGGGYIHTSV